MAKKRPAPKKTARKKTTTKRARSARGDQSRLDLKPLHRHIKKRIKELQDAAAAAGPVAASPDDTIERLQNALETIEEICHPTMAIPI